VTTYFNPPALIQITLPDKSVREFPEGITGHEIAKNISEGLARDVLSISVNGEVWEINRPIHNNADVQLFTWKDLEGKATFWHSSAHILAEAVESLYPGAKFGIGPAIENGFYYDIDFGDRVISPDDLEKIENQFMTLARSGETFLRKDISKADAIAYFTDKGDEYKLELLEGLEDGNITFYHSGNFVDLCRGPHIPDSSVIKAVKILNIAGAYWRGDEKRKMLTRLYAITFPKQKELTEYLEKLEEAKKRDHRKLGQQMELFAFSDKVGMGLPLWLPKGTALRERLEKFLRKVQVEEGYEPVITPHIAKKELYVCSGHYEKYGKDSFQPIQTPQEGEEFFLKPMNCPHHCEIYKFKPRSYRDLPVRFSEFGTVYRYEQSGELHGLTRVRGFTQDDAHIFCTPDQVKGEFRKVIDIVLLIFKTLGFAEYVAQISLRDPNNREKYIGADELWEKAESAIQEACLEKQLPTVTVYGEAAFYGPKLDFMVRDALGRKWQLGTIQVDYNLPDRFELEYTGADNQKHRPVMIHRAPFGSLERFIAVLLEHTAGDFPLWLIPDQVILLPVSERFSEYTKKVADMLKISDIRTLIDDRSEKIGRKIRDAEVGKIPMMLIIGEKEIETETVSVRRHKSGDVGVMKLSEFVEYFREAEMISRNPEEKLLDA